MDGLNLRRIFLRSPENLRNARKIVVDFARTWLAGDALLEVEIAVGEALSNVVAHGSGRTFTVSCERNNDRVVVEIADRGLGFEPASGHGQQPEIGSPRGYGIFLMHHLLDEIEYVDRGTRLRLVKTIRTAHAQDMSRADDAC